MGIFKREKASAAQAAVSEEQGSVEHNDVDTEIALLEKVVDDDPAAKAAEELDAFIMAPGVKSLLDRALDNIATNKGANLPDPDARLLTSLRSDLVEASGNDLGIVLETLVEACEKPQDVAGTVYSLCFNVVKAAGFICNLDYRRYLDPRGDFDLGLYGSYNGEQSAEFAADRREEDPSAPPGLDTSIDRELEFYREMYGASIEDIDDIFAAALSDLRLFMQLTTESFGWDPDRPVPYSVVMEPNGSFTHITDAQLALDHFEVKRKEAQARRREQEGARLAAAASKARAIVAAKLAR